MNNMKKNEKLYMAVEDILSNGRKLKFNEINKEIKDVLDEEEYDEKKLRNVLYRQVKVGRIKRNEEGRYYLNNLDINGCEKNSSEQIQQGNPVLTQYILDLLKLCKDKDKKFGRPFDNFSDGELLNVGEAYRFNKEIMDQLKKKLNEVS